MGFRFYVQDPKYVEYRKKSLLPDADRVIDKILDQGKDRAVFFLQGRLIDFPAGGPRARKQEEETPNNLVGVYDCEAVASEIIDDVLHLEMMEMPGK